MLSEAQATCRYCGNIIKLVITRKYLDNSQEFNRLMEALTVLGDRHKYEECEVYSAERNVSLFPNELRSES